LVFNYHAWGSTPELQVLITGIYQRADHQNFAVLTPRGGPAPFPFSLVGYSFNAGGCCPDSSPCIDHVGVIPRLIESAKLALMPVEIDMGRIYATGISNGGMMAARAACMHPSIFAAAATVSGTLSPSPAEDFDSMCTETNQPVHLLHLHGRLDPIVPYGGKAFRVESPFPYPHGPFPSAHSHVSRWLIWAGGQRREPDQSFSWRDVDCIGLADGVNVTLCTLAWGGHSWPGSSLLCNPLNFPFQCSTTIDATDEIVKFFMSHRKCAADVCQPSFSNGLGAATLLERVSNH